MSLITSIRSELLGLGGGGGGGGGEDNSNSSITVEAVVKKRKSKKKRGKVAVYNIDDLDVNGDSSSGEEGRGFMKDYYGEREKTEEEMRREKYIWSGPEKVDTNTNLSEVIRSMNNSKKRWDRGDKYGEESLENVEHFVGMMSTLLHYQKQKKDFSSFSSDGN